MVPRIMTKLILYRGKWHPGVGWVSKAQPTAIGRLPVGCASLTHPTSAGRWQTFLFLLLAISLVAALDPPAKKKPARAVELPPLNMKVCDYAKEQLGKKVGSGQCTQLAEQALKAAGAKRMVPHGPDEDYIWGQSISSPKDALPGDILQFRNAVFEGRTVSKSRVTSWHSEYPHHTAVVLEVRDNGRTIVVLHQNVGKDGTPIEKKQIVQRDTIKADSLTRGTSGSSGLSSPNDVATSSNFAGKLD